MDRTALRQTLKELLEQETWETYDHVDDSMSLREGLKLDSVDMISLVLEIQNRFQIEIDSRELEGVQQVGHLLDLLQAKISSVPQKKAA